MSNSSIISVFPLHFEIQFYNFMLSLAMHLQPFYLHDLAASSYIQLSFKYIVSLVFQYVFSHLMLLSIHTYSCNEKQGTINLKMLQ